jgi:hypothetical protein
MTELISDSRVSRRSLLTRSAASGVGVALIGSVDGLFGASASAQPAGGRGKPGQAGYGPLVPDPAGILSLPAPTPALPRPAPPPRPGRDGRVRATRRQRQRARQQP